MVARSEVKFGTRGVLVDHVRGTSDFAVFKVIWRSFGTLVISRKYNSRNAASFTLIILLQPHFLITTSNFCVNCHRGILNLEEAAM